MDTGIFSAVIIGVIVLQFIVTVAFIRSGMNGIIESVSSLMHTTESQQQNLEDLRSIVAKQQHEMSLFNETAAAQQKNIELLSETAATQQENMAALNSATERQQKNLTAMEKRIVETEKIGELYRSLYEEMPGAVEKYTKIMSRMRDDALKELDKAVALGDEGMQSFKEREVENIETQIGLISELPQLMSNLHEALEPLNERLKLFSERGKYPTGSVLPYPARRAKSLLAAIGDQATLSGGSLVKTVRALTNGKPEPKAIKSPEDS